MEAKHFQTVLSKSSETTHFLFLFFVLFCFVLFFLFFKTSFWENFYRIQSRYVNGNVNENLAETCDRGPWHMVKNRGDGQHTTRALSCTVKTRH